MDRYKKLLAKYDKIKEEYKNNRPNAVQDKILLTIESDLSELKNAIINDNSARILELNVKIKMFLDGFKLLPDKTASKK